MRPFVFAVAGGSGSGKTTIVQRLVDQLDGRDVVVIQHDSYYCPDPKLSFPERQKLNYDHPDLLETRLLVEHLDQLKQGAAVQVPIYDFVHHARRPQSRRVEPKKIIIIEGILVLVDAALRQRMDLSVFVDTDDDVRFIRRLQRDQEERGRTTQSVIRQYLSTVKPMHLRFVAPSKRHADLVIRGDGRTQAGIEVLLARLKAIP
ncbi:MAG: uridine kinase [Acidobacteriota bacterium]